MQGDSTRETFLQNRSAASLNRERHEVCSIYMHLTSLWWNKVHSIDGHFVEPKSGPEIRFGIQPRGVNKFGIIIKTMCAEAGFVWELLKPLGETNMFLSGKLRD